MSGTCLGLVRDMCGTCWGRRESREHLGSVGTGKLFKERVVQDHIKAVQLGMQAASSASSAVTW